MRFVIILLFASSCFGIWHDTITVGEYIGGGERYLHPRIIQKEITIPLICENWLTNDKDCDLDGNGVVNWLDMAICVSGDDVYEVEYYEMIKYGE